MLNTQMISKVAGIGLAASLTLAGTANKAQALSFDFSFGSGSPGGEITGRVGGLNDNSTGPASYVWFNSPVSETFDIGTASFNSFEVTGGAVTSDSFNADGFNSPTQLRLFPGSSFGSYDTSFGNVTYTAVPFGVSTNMSIAILASLYGASRLRKKFAVGNNK